MPMLRPTNPCKTAAMVLALVFCAAASWLPAQTAPAPGNPQGAPPRRALPLALNSQPFLWQSSCMDKGSILEVLCTHEPELKASGVVHLRLFGSVARGESSVHSE